MVMVAECLLITHGVHVLKTQRAEQKTSDGKQRNAGRPFCTSTPSYVERYSPCHLFANATILMVRLVGLVSESCDSEGGDRAVCCFSCASAAG